MRPLLALLAAVARTQTVVDLDGPWIDRRDPGWLVDRPLNALRNDASAFNRGELSPLTPPPEARAHHAAACVGWRLYVFGGVDADGYARNDLHFFDARAMAWSGPVERPFATSAGADGDGDPHDLAATPLRGDIRAGVAFEARPARSEVVGDGAPPCPRAWHAMADVGAKVFVFGGAASHAGYTERAFARDRYAFRLDGDAQYMHDMHYFDTATMRWSGALSGRGRGPSPRAGAAMAAVGDVLFVFGGEGANDRPFGDLALFNTTSREWNLAPPAASNGPSPRSRARFAGPTDATAAGLGARTLWLFGGLWRGRGRHADVDGYGTKEVVNERLAEFVLDDTWALDCDTLEWTKVHGGASDARRYNGAPLARHSHHALATSGGWMLAFGGLGDSPGFGDAPLDDAAVFRLPGARETSPPGAREANVGGMMNHHADLHHGEMHHHRTPGISHTTVSGEYLEWRAAPSPLDPLAGDVHADSDLHLDTVRPASPVDPAPRPRLGAAYDSMGLPWNDARRVVEPDEGAAPNARELLLEFGGFVVDSDDALETAEPLEMYPFELTNELFIYQRAKVPISGDDVDLYVLVDRVV